MTDTVCPTCGYPTQNNAYTCEDCLTSFGNFIGSIPALEEQLLITMTGQRSPTMGYSAPSSEKPMPYNTKAGDLLTQLRNHLAGWVRQCQKDNVRNSSPHTQQPNTKHLGSMTDWLLWRIDGMAWVQWSPQAVQAATKLEELVMRTIDPVVSRTYLGNCDCGAQVWLKDGETTGHCAGCARTHPADQMRTKLETELDDRLMTADEVATAMVIMAYPKPREWVAGAVARWGCNARENKPGRKLHERGHKEVKGVQRPLYRYGEARDLLARAMVGRVG